MRARQPVFTSPSVYYTYHHPPAQYHDPAFPSLAYRPLHVPLQHPLSTAAAEQHQHQLSLAAAVSGFEQQRLQQVPLYHHHQQQHPQQIPIRTRDQPRKMASTYQGTDEELAELQKLSNEYEPEVTVRMPAALSLQPCRE